MAIVFRAGSGSWSTGDIRNQRASPTSRHHSSPRLDRLQNIRSAGEGIAMRVLAHGGDLFRARTSDRVQAFVRLGCIPIGVTEKDI